MFGNDIYTKLKAATERYGQLIKIWNAGEYKVSEKDELEQALITLEKNIEELTYQYEKSGGVTNRKPTAVNYGGGISFGTPGGYGTKPKQSLQGGLFGGGIKNSTHPVVEDELPKFKGINRDETPVTPVAPVRLYPRFPYITLAPVVEVVKNNNRILTGYKEQEIPEMLEEEEVLRHNPILLVDEKYSYSSPMDKAYIPKEIIQHIPINTGFHLIDFDKDLMFKRYMINTLLPIVNKLLMSVEIFMNKSLTMDDFMGIFKAGNGLDTSKAKRLTTVFKKVNLIDSDIKGMYELTYNRKSIYINNVGTFVPENETNFFISEESHEIFYSTIIASGADWGILETIDYKFEFYVGVNKILLIKC